MALSAMALITILVEAHGVTVMMDVDPLLNGNKKHETGNLTWKPYLIAWSYKKKLYIY